MSLETLTTKRLTLVPVTLDDVGALYAIAQNPASIEDYQYVPESPGKVKEWLAEDVAQEKPTWTIRLGGEVIGLIEAGVRKSGAMAEPGYFVDAQHQGNGYATEALKPVLDWIFLNTNVHRIEVEITDTNTASRRVAEKCDFVYEGVKRKNFPFKGQWLNSAQYSILKEEWEPTT